MAEAGGMINSCSRCPATFDDIQDLIKHFVTIHAIAEKGSLAWGGDETEESKESNVKVNCGGETPLEGNDVENGNVGNMTIRENEGKEENITSPYKVREENIGKGYSFPGICIGDSSFNNNW